MSNQLPLVLLATPYYADIDIPLKRNLQFLGFEVIDIVADNSQFQYESWHQHASIKFKKIFLQDKFAKDKARDIYLTKKYLNKLDGYQKIDYALFIRPDLFSNEFIEAVKQKVVHTICAYQWDGMDRFPEVWRTVDLFDKFFVFDKNDLAKSPQLMLTNNFYFDYNLDKSERISNNAYFLGAHVDGREQVINRFAEYALTRNIKVDISILDIKQKHLDKFRKIYPFKNIELSDEVLSFEQNLARCKQSSVLLDFKAPVHNGLSFRPFEALGYGKKLITTNTAILNYDFYHPNNILVWDGQDFEIIDIFLKKPYHPLPENIIKKYAFSYWIKSIFTMS